MELKYFCAPKLSELLPTVKPGLFKDLGELQPLTVRTPYPGLAYDFNCGLRLQIPKGNYHVKILDADSELVCFDDDVSDTVLISLEKFFVRWRFFIERNGQPFFHYAFNPTGRNVHVHFVQPFLGDSVVFFYYMEQFRKNWKCNLSCSTKPYLQELLRLYFPQIKCEPPDTPYATYLPTQWFNPMLLPKDFRRVPIERAGQQLFGLNRAERIVYAPTKPRRIEEPYVCIAAQSAKTVKAWLNPGGWKEVVDYLKFLGYRVLCIDRDKVQSGFGYTIKMPEGAEDFTGDIPLSERINLLAYAEFFIGASSGLSWLAWAANCPVILVSGITEPFCEFATPYRVVNPLVCYGCYNDVDVPWEGVYYCPRFRGTPRAFECSKKISGHQVIQMIDRVRNDKAAGSFSYHDFL